MFVQHCFVNALAGVPALRAGKLVALVVTGVACLAAVHPARAQISIVRAEEDWELVVGQPDQVSDAPQVTSVLSPRGDLSGVYAVLELNYHTQPQFAAGGMQLQLWNAGVCVTATEIPNQALLNHDNETIRWTQQMRLEGTTLVFEIVNGSSQSWGEFGGQGTLKIVTQTGLQSLGEYDPQVSLNQTGVGFASQRVASLVLKEVRWYSDAGLVFSQTGFPAVR